MPNSGTYDKSEERDWQAYPRGPRSDRQEGLHANQKLAIEERELALEERRLAVEEKRVALEERKFALEVSKQAFRDQEIVPETSRPEKRFVMEQNTRRGNREWTAREGATPSREQRRARSPQSPRSPRYTSPREYRDRRELPQQPPPPPPPPPPPSQQCAQQLPQQLPQRTIQPVGWRPPGYQHRQDSEFDSNERRTFSQQSLSLNRTPRPSSTTIMQTHKERYQHEQKVTNHDAEMEALKRALKEKEAKAEERKNKKIKEETEW